MVGFELLKGSSEKELLQLMDAKSPEPKKVLEMLHVKFKDFQVDPIDVFAISKKGLARAANCEHTYAKAHLQELMQWPVEHIQTLSQVRAAWCYCWHGCEMGSL